MEAIKALVDVLGPEGTVLWQAIKDGRVSFVVSDGGVAVTPKGGN